MTTPKTVATAGEPVAYVVVGRDGYPAKRASTGELLWSTEPSRDLVSEANMTWPHNNPHRSLPLYAKHEAPQAGDADALLRAVPELVARIMHWVDRHDCGLTGDDLPDRIEHEVRAYLGKSKTGEGGE